MATLQPDDYCIAWIAPLEIEAQAARHMLDRKHDGRFIMDRGDDYIFQAGEMCGHNVIIATLPAGQEYGTGSAAALASQVKKFFPNLWFGLLVGVAAGLPDLERNPPRDIRLGDVLVSLQDNDSSGLVAYELGRETANSGLTLLRDGHILAQTEPVIRSAIRKIKLDWPDEAQHFVPYYEAMKDKRHQMGTFRDPGPDNDMLYQVANDGSEKLMERPERGKSDRTQVWYGSIGSGEKVMKCATQRDELRRKHDIIGLEMEAAGTMNRIPVGVIRGVCDYADQHKNSSWQPYAAAMAAAYAKAILAQIGPGGASSRARISNDDPKTGPDKQSRKHSTDTSTDEDNDNRYKKRRRSRKAQRATLGHQGIDFRGQGNVNIGSGSISIGRDQKFITRES